MSSTDRRPSRGRLGRRSARSRLAAAGSAAACAAALAGCAVPTGRFPHEDTIGVASGYNVAVQAGYPPAPDKFALLVEDFRNAAPDTVNFDFDRSSLRDGAEDVVAAQAAWLREHPGALVRIYGHADLVGPESYNDRLGLRRAQMVARRLAALGVAPRRLAVVASLGERAPVVPVEAREPRNRRAVTSIEGWGVGWDGDAMDGKRAQLGYDEYVRDDTEAVQIDATGGAAGGSGG